MSQHAAPPLRRAVIAEVFGTFLLVFFGCGAVHTAVLMGAQQGLWQVAIVWGLAIMLAIYSIGGVSGAHINPAMTLAFAAFRGFPISRVVPYILGQLLGAILAASTLLTLFQPQLVLKEFEKKVTRGSRGSEITAMCYGEYFPNPGPFASGSEPLIEKDYLAAKSRVPHSTAFIAELLGTAILAFVVFAVTDARNPGRPADGQAPIFIGLTVSALISVLAPLTQACFNPARDFGPRLVAAFGGWGAIAWPGMADLGWLTVYIIAPILGALVGSAIYEYVIRPEFPVTTKVAR